MAQKGRPWLRATNTRDGFLVEIVGTQMSHKLTRDSILVPHGKGTEIFGAEVEHMLLENFPGWASAERVSADKAAMEGRHGTG